MPRTPPSRRELNVDLEGGVVPISKAASSMAALISRSRGQQQPIVITQKGYPAAVLLPIDLFVKLHKHALQAIQAGVSLPEAAPPADEVAGEAEKPRRRGGRRRKAEQVEPTEQAEQSE